MYRRKGKKSYQVLYLASNLNIECSLWTTSFRRCCNLPYSKYTWTGQNGVAVREIQTLLDSLENESK